jgi:hypothetical protein
MMKNSHKMSKGVALRTAMFILMTAALAFSLAHVSSVNVSANHPVLVEGNCDSPVPGTINVPVIAATPGGTNSAGICGDFDGDGRIGTAEDTDGADRIFGTINAAIGPGTGAAAGTGANFNGRVTIVASGRFAEAVYIGVTQSGPGTPGITNPGNVTLEAAPGVSAVIDAVLQGDPAGGNNARQAVTGVAITYRATGPERMVTLRNLTIRNFANGIQATENTRIHIDNCVLENNLNYGIRLNNGVRAVITNTQVTATGFRIGTATAVPNPGHGIAVEQSAQARIINTQVQQNVYAGIFNQTGNAANVVLFKVSSHFNGFDILGPFTSAPDPNVSSGE